MGMGRERQKRRLTGTVNGEVQVLRARMAENRGQDGWCLCVNPSSQGVIIVHMMPGAIEGGRNASCLHRLPAPWLGYASGNARSTQQTSETC